MIELYCHHHGKRMGLCQSCTDLYEYTVFKYDHCPFGDNKPVCSKCKVHCYNKNRREEIREIMRYSASRMLLTRIIHAKAKRYRLVIKGDNKLSIDYLSALKIV